MTDEQISGLPVHGYQPQTADDIEMVNVNKEAEERILRRIEELSGLPKTDPRWLAIAKTHFEQGFMAMNRAIFRPKRVRLPEDRSV